MSALQFLLLEANPRDAELVEATLIAGGIDCVLLQIETCADLLAILEADNAINLILADYAVSGSDEITALTIARRLRPDIPFIFISGILGEELAIAAIQQGATDYVLKQRLERLVSAVQQALHTAQVHREQQRTQEVLQKTEAYFRAIANLVPDMLWRNDTRGNTAWYNQRWLDYTGQTMEEAQGYGWLEVIHPEDRAQSLANFQNSVNERCLLRQEHRIRDTKGNYRWFLVQTYPVLDANGNIIQWFGAASDIHEQRLALESLRASEEKYRTLFNITNRKLAEEQLRRAAKFDEFRVALSDALRPLTDPIEIQRAAMRVIGECLQLDRVMYGEINEQEDECVIADNYVANDAPKFVGRFRCEDFGQIIDRLRTGEVSFICDMNDDEEVSALERQSFSAFGILAAIGVPLIKAGRWVSTLGAHSFRPRKWSEDDILLLRETAERTWDAVERARAEAAVAADLEDTQLLHNLATRLVRADDIETLYQEIVTTAIALMRSAAGSLQILDEATQELVLLATQGCSRTFAEHFYRLDASYSTSCGMALSQGKRVFVNFDTPLDADNDDVSRRMHLDAGLVCAQSTPLIARSGKAIGMVSTHWSEHHRLSDRELRFLDLLARQAADVLEQRQAQAKEMQLIQEQAAREQERQRAESLAELDRTKTAFFSNVSHEFRTPLTLILSLLEEALLSLNSEDEQAKSPPSIVQEQLQVVHRNSLRLLKLVNTLLDFSRIEAGRLKTHYQPTNLSSYTAELASLFRSAIEKANLQLIVDCPPLPAPVDIDREMWEKIVLNLLSNALKFTFEGRISISLKVNTANEVELIVSDTGVGIVESELPHLFERFYQVKGANGRSYEGSGIGLSLVQELIKLHGGAIAVTSAVEVGTSFTVTIPIGTAHAIEGDTSTQAATAVTANAFVEEAWSWLPEESESVPVSSESVLVASESVLVANETVPVPSESVLVSSESVPVPSESVLVASETVPVASETVPVASETVQAQNSKKAHILLVDDNADMRDYVHRLLSSRYDVTTVADGVAALAAAQQSSFDLVLSDIMMPKMDGFELLRSLRSDPHTRAMPIILLSARAGEESRVEGLETGADDYLVKPFSARELLARVDVNIKLVQMRREAVYREQVMQAIQTLNERLEQQVKARTAQLEAINQELEAFSSLVSHDLRTPLRYINSFAERLQGQLNSTANASSLQTLNIIIKSALQAEKMVDDLLEFSRLGQTEMRTTTVMISELVQQVQQQLQPELVERSLHWQIEPLPQVKGDPVLLRLVVQNLLSNAVKYTRNNTEAAITIGSIEHELEVIVYVKDNGAGFDMKYRDRLFSMFQRLHSQEEFAGTGVGLATARRIIHRHSGRIWAEGAINQGATFYFALPKY
ncbi:ATP-binding protein [Fortiea contorta]|uniref:ATP-binding protein n=1 Tax=Fortiea contorta TaxID=1892405 RepID=UPI000345A6CF|nr:ATP-binding protein [Fortiea contorta]